MEPRPFRLIRNLGRSREIVAVLLNHGFGDLVDRAGVRDTWYRWRRRFARKGHPPAPLPHVTTVERIRRTLEDLGPTFIKFGQVMSTRPDLVPQPMIAELERLQEGVPPFPSDTAVAELERELDRPIDQLFASFDRVPLAAGSLGQVHRAVHFDGTPLAVKIRRPDAVRDVERDVSLMLEIASLAERHIPETRVFDPLGLVNHFQRTIRRELNFAREGRSMDEFRRLFKGDPALRVPAVFWELTTESVLTMEFIDGLRIDQLEQCAGMPCSTADLAAHGARIFMKQAFEFGIFHGDPHPGNIRVGADGTLCLLDYGMIGMLETETREKLVDLFVAVAKQDVDSAVDLVLDIGEAVQEVDQPLLHVDMRDFVANYYGMELERLHVGRMLSDFVTIMSTHSIRCPGSLMLLIRALVTLEGIGRKLDPNFNLAGHLQPFVEALVKDRYEPRRIVDRLAHDARALAKIAGTVPKHLANSLRKISEDDIHIQLQHQNLDHFISEMERASNRLVVGIVVAALIVASALIISRGVNIVWLTIPIYILSSLLAIWLVYGIFRSGRL